MARPALEFDDAVVARDEVLRHRETQPVPVERLVTSG